MQNLKEIENRINQRLKEKFGEDYKNKNLIDCLPIIYEELGIPYCNDPNVGYDFNPPPDYNCFMKEL